MTQEESYQKVAEIADVLLARGVPVLKFGVDPLGGKVSMAFALHDQEATYIARLPVDTASVRKFEDLYRAVA